MAMADISTIQQSHYEAFMDSDNLTELASQWWRIIAPYADRCFARMLIVTDMQHIDDQIGFVRELYETVEYIAELPCPIPLTTARRQMLNALDTMIASYQLAITGDPERALQENHSAIGQLMRVRATLSGFDVEV